MHYAPNTRKGLAGCLCFTSESYVRLLLLSLHPSETRARVTTLPKVKTMATIASLAAGFSIALVGASPAGAIPPLCGLGGISLGGGICQLTYTAGSATFTPVAGTTKLEALLVGGGGSSSNYGYGGGGGQVKLMNFSDTSTAVNLTVGGSETSSSATQGATTTTALNGQAPGGVDGGTSGSGFAGWLFSNNSPGVFGAAGGGAGASPTATQTGGAGVEVASLAPSGSLFASDTNCYGGGGGIQDSASLYGTATCGGGYAHKVGSTPTLVPPTPNTGGGAGSLYQLNVNPGGSGVVVIRWQTDHTVTFVLNGHGTAIPAQAVGVGATATQPPAPSATGVTFYGWYADPGLTTKANFSAPITTNTTFYASWGADPGAPVATPVAGTVNFTG